MPYREPSTDANPESRILPRLHSGADPTPGVRRRLLEDETSIEVPWVYLSIDGANPVTPDELRRDFVDEAAAWRAATDHLDATRIAGEQHGSVRVYRGERATEMLLSRAFLQRLHEELGSKKLFVGIPRRGWLLAIDQRVPQSALHEVAEAWGASAEPLTTWILRVERGRLKGRAERAAATSATPPPRAPALRLRVAPSAAIEPAAYVPRPLPAGLRGSMVRMVAAALVCVVATLVAGALRAALRRPEAPPLMVASAEALESVRASTAAFEREVDACEVRLVETTAGTERLVTSPAQSESALVYILARMGREAEAPTDSAPLSAVRGLLSRGQRHADMDLDGLAARLQEQLRAETGHASLEVSLADYP